MVYTYIEITVKTKFICMVKAVSYVQKWQISVICITCDCDEARGQNGNMHAVLQSPLTGWCYHTAQSSTQQLNCFQVYQLCIKLHRLY